MLKCKCDDYIPNHYIPPRCISLWIASLIITLDDTLPNVILVFSNSPVPLRKTLVSKTINVALVRDYDLADELDRG